MSVLLLPISKEDDLYPLISICDKIAGYLNYELLCFTYNNSEKLFKDSFNNIPIEVNHSTKDLFTTIFSFLHSSSIDVAMIISSINVVSIQNRKKTFSFFSKIRKLIIPYLVLPAVVVPDWKPESILLPICLSDGEKEASAWAGYLTKSHNAKVYIIHPNFKDGMLKQYLQRNIGFIKNLFNNEKVAYEIFLYGYKSKHASLKAIEMATEKINSLLVMPVSRRSFLEYLFKVPSEIMLLKSGNDIPILFVSPRHDLYLPC